MKNIFAILCVVIFLVSFNASAAHHGKAASQKKAVLITGANSGLGLKMTEVLSRNGFFVYAGVLHKREMKAMNEMENVVAVQFDVRNQKEVDAAAKFITSQGRGLYGLINNAGVAVFGPLLEVPIEQLRYQMEVNVFGPARVTQAFAPLIIESKGRIATTGSIAGILSRALFGPYSMSKHAIEAYTDSLAQEMTRFGVSVHVIEPGNYASNIGNATKKLLEDTNYWPEKTRYEQERSGLYSQLGQVSLGADPIDVANAALHLMQSNAPKKRYMVTARRSEAEATLRRQISKMLELNENQAHLFSRRQLIEMLDEEIARNTGATANVQ